MKSFNTWGTLLNHLVDQLYENEYTFPGIIEFKGHECKIGGIGGGEHDGRFTVKTHSGITFTLSERPNAVVISAYESEIHDDQTIGVEIPEYMLEDLIVYLTALI